MLLQVNYTIVSQASAHSRLSAHVTVCMGCSNGKRPLLGKCPGNVSQDRRDDKADKNTYKDDGDVDDLDPFSDSDE